MCMSCVYELCVCVFVGSLVILFHVCVFLITLFSCLLVNWVIIHSGLVRY